MTEDALANIKTNVFSEPEPNWTQARNDQSEPLAEDSPIPKRYLYYDPTMKAYVYDPDRKPQRVTIKVESEPEMTDAFMLKVIRMLPEYLPIPYDVPIGIDICVFHSDRDDGYKVGENAAEWVKWLTEHFEGCVWAFNNQISAIGCEIRYGKLPRFVLTIVMA